MVPRYKLNSTALITKSEVQDLAKALTETFFDEWSKDFTEIESRSMQTALIATLDPKSNGRSGAVVMGLAFSDGVSDLSSFIMKIFQGSPEESKSLIVEELTYVDELKALAPWKDLFSFRFWTVEAGGVQALVYEHANGQAGEPLFSMLTEARLCETEAAVKKIDQEISRLEVNLPAAFSPLRPTQYWNGQRLWNHLSTKLPLDILLTIDGDGLWDADTLTFPTANGDGPYRTPLDSPFETLADMTEAASWVSFVGKLERIYEKKLVLSCDGARVLLEASPASVLSPGVSVVRIVFRRDLAQFRTVDQLVASAVPERVQFTIAKAKEIFVTRPKLEMILAHGDLHCENVLCGLSALKVIDFGSIDFWPKGWDISRLKLSLLYDLAKEESNESSLIAGIASLNSLAEPRYPEDARKVLAYRLRPISAPCPEEHLLAQLLQALLFMRLAMIRNESLRVAALLVEQTFAIIQKRLQEGLGSTQEKNRPLFESKLHEPNLPTLHDLWNQALTLPALAGLRTGKAEKCLRAVAGSERALEFLGRKLTQIQAKIFNECQRGSNPFHSEKNVIIAAPTSSGKSTLAEIFLMTPFALNSSRQCAVYIAPTRALTQAKYKDLIDRFGSLEEIKSEIVLSTGEDTDDDWKIRHGAFAVACMVYEKANILFSQNRTLVDRLACVVVDELHVLADLGRGPVLEVAIAKILFERRRVDSETIRAPSRESIRIIAVTTEDALGEDIIALLSIVDVENAELVKPIVFKASERPVPVNHYLVLQDPANEEMYSEVLLTTFEDDSKRSLPADDIAKLMNRLPEAAVESKIHVRKPLIASELLRRQHLFVAERIKDFPLGRRILVFVRSRNDVESQARRLASELRGPNRNFSKLSEKLKEKISNTEDKRVADSLRVCAECGILIHHSDVDKKLRREIEDICGAIASDEPSQVIFATETLSYGVNLAVHDVVLVGIQFNTQNRKREPVRVDLSSCAFHNMLGRAGRLGKTANEDGNAFIFLAQDSEPTSIIQNYYLGSELVSSRLFVSDDRDVLLTAIEDAGLEIGQEIENPEIFKDLGAENFSYPFVRSVLDALRHLNMLEGESSAVSSPQLNGLLGYTLYSRQKLGPTARGLREKKLFRSAVQRILDDCSQEPLRLIESDGPLYRITSRGEAVIDTGTEISTIGPVVRMVRLLWSAWQEKMKISYFPSELFILALICQKEMTRQYLAYIPECKGGVGGRDWTDETLWQKNIAAVRSDFLEAIRGLVGIENFNGDRAMMLWEKVRELLDQWEPVKGISSRYRGGVAEALLRQFCGVCRWISGDDRPKVEAVLEGADLEERLRTRFQGFRQFMEAISIKVVFLARILATDKERSEIFGPAQERALIRISPRLRLGCLEAAIPLFWPFSSDFQRSEASRLIQSGMSPSLILRDQRWSDRAEGSSIKLEKMRRLRSDLANYAAKELEELAKELTVSRRSDDPAWESLAKLWRDLEAGAFKRFIDEYLAVNADSKSSKGRGAARGPSFSDLVIARFFNGADLSANKEERTVHLANGSLSGERSFRVLIERSEWGWELLLDEEAEVQPGSVFDLKRNKKRKYVTSKRMRFVGLNWRQDGACRRDGLNWEAYSESSSRGSGGRVIVVCSPWLPLGLEKVSPLRSYISVGGFCVILSVLVRGLCDCKRFMTSLESLTSSLNGPYINISDLVPLIEADPDRTVPPAIWEKLLRHFEVDCLDISAGEGASVQA